LFGKKTLKAQNSHIFQIFGWGMVPFPPLATAMTETTAKCQLAQFPTGTTTNQKIFLALQKIVTHFFSEQL